MNFKEQNDNARAFFNQDFSLVNNLILCIRKSLCDGSEPEADFCALEKFMNFTPGLSFVYVSLFQSETEMIRFGSKRDTLKHTLERIISGLKSNQNFSKFEINNPDKCRIMFEYVTSRRELPYKKIQSSKFNSLRFEIGIDGIEINDGTQSYYYMPTDAIVQSHMGFKNAFSSLLKKTPIAKMTNRISERLKLFATLKDWKFYLFNTRAFISYKNECIALYRANVRYCDFDFDILINQFTRSANWLIKNMQNDGRFLYYYDCTTDSTKDHEHPTRPEHDRYYNDLRHCGGAITLIRAYSYSGDEKYINAAKKALDFTVTTAVEHWVDGKKAYHAYYNQKSKLGGSGMALVAMMQYRIVTGDKCYDEYIKGFVRHLISRLTPEGEFMGYYIHPGYNNGEPLLNMSDEERMETFSFYYPGEALLGLGLFANHFEDDNELKEFVVEKTRLAMDWIVDERPKRYSHLFTPLPSDAWLMQSIEEWYDYKGFIKENHLNFVFTDANEMMKRMYQRDDSPYIDYEGGMYYEYGDHYYPDGARCEGLIASYYLAKKAGRHELAEQILCACKKAAMCQFHLFNDERSNFAHKNWAKSLDSIRFKATRQWVRVDSIQHVACFFIRLYWSKFDMKIKNYLDKKA